jgi:hypothetical protein
MADFPIEDGNTVVPETTVKDSRHPLGAFTAPTPRFLSRTAGGTQPNHTTPQLIPDPEKQVI